MMDSTATAVDAQLAEVDAQLAEVDAQLAAADDSTLALYGKPDAAAIASAAALEFVLESRSALPAEKVAQLTDAFERIDKDSDGAAQAPDDRISLDGYIIRWLDG